MHLETFRLVSLFNHEPILNMSRKAAVIYDLFLPYIRVMTHVQCQENVMKSLSNLTSVQLMFSGLTCCGVQGIWAALLVLSVSLLLPGCIDFCKLKHLS